METSKAIDAAATSLGFSTLREKQREAITRFVEGHDVFVSLPTGSGKSLCYYVLPLAYDMIRKNKQAKCMIVIISPLTALIKDQIATLAEKGLKGVHVTSEVAESENDDLIELLHVGNFQYVFFSPETLLGNQCWRDLLQTSQYQDNVVGIIVDEAHVVHKWGISFRTEYSHIGEVRSILPAVHMMALTATATKSTRIEICHSLGMKKACVIFQSPNKMNIVYEVDMKENSIESAFMPLIEEVRCKRQEMDRTIIFCRSYDSCVYIWHLFRSSLGRDMTEPKGFMNHCELRIVDMFSACTEVSIKDIILKQFRDPTSCLRVVVATVAFGMGLDCPNVRNVVHWGLPPDVESYLQESGRAGRDGKQATAKLYGAVKDCAQFADHTMKGYCRLTLGQCRRKFLISHFDEQVDLSVIVGTCKCCDNCAPLCLCEYCFS